MSNYLATYADVTISGSLTKARDKKEPRVIQNQFLDGSYNVQTIGTPGQKIEIEFYCSTAVRRQLEHGGADGDLIKVYYEGKIWTGNIDKGMVSWDYFTSEEEKVTFNLLVYSEEDE